jgi:hypothetical protein
MVDVCDVSDIRDICVTCNFAGNPDIYVSGTALPSNMTITFSDDAYSKIKTHIWEYNSIEVADNIFDNDHKVYFACKSDPGGAGCNDIEKYEFNNKLVEIRYKAWFAIKTAFSMKGLRRVFSTSWKHDLMKECDNLVKFD